MNTADLVEWQIIAPNGLVYPWWTHPFLEVLEGWNLNPLFWLETGGGRSTAWLRSQCAWVDTIEANEEWAAQARQDCDANGLVNGRIFAKTIPDGVPERMPEYFSLIPDNLPYDVISVDGIYRTEMIEWAIDYFKRPEYKGAGILVADNLDQDFVWISPRAMEALAPYEANIFVQPNHINHEGKPWNTRYYIIK